MNYSIMIGVHDPELAKPVQESLYPFPTTVVNGKGFPSFSYLVNQCIIQAKEEIVIFCSHRVRPTPKDIERMINLLNFGYGLVGLYRFGFFGFHKDLIRQIGFFDETFIGGGWEDDDIQVRLLEANISYYENESVDYFGGPSTWSSELTPQIFKDKWDINNGIITRKRKEQCYSYDIGKYKLKGQLFLPWNKSNVMGHTLAKYYKLKLQS